MKYRDNLNISAQIAKYAIWVIILAGIFIRLFNIGMPLLEGASTRQIYNAMVARNFYEHGLNFFYPFIEIRGDTPYVQALEAPVVPYIAAILYHFFGGAHTEILRIISIFSTAIAVFFLYHLVSFISDKSTALVAVFLFNFYPISIFTGRSAVHEMTLMAFIIAAVYYFLRWVKEERFIFSVLAGVFFILAVLIKKPCLYLLLPFAYLAFSKWKWKAIGKSYIVLIALFIVLCWQAWEWHLRAHFPDPQWIHFDLRHHLGRIIYTYTSADFYKKIYSDVVDYVLTPLGVTFFLIGVFLKTQRQTYRLLYSWLAAVVFFYLIMPEQFWAHGYYHVHYLPIASFFAASGFIFVVRQIFPERDLFSVKAKILVASFALVFLIMSVRHSLYAYIVPDSKSQVLSAAERINHIAGKDELVIVSADNPACLLYYSHRKGWPFYFMGDLADSIAKLDDFRSKGADYLASAYKVEIARNEAFWNYLRNNYEVIGEDSRFIIFDIRKKKNNAKF